MDIKLGDRLKQLRTQKNLTQDEMASILGVDRSTLASWEVNRREPDISVLCLIADHFEVTLDWLAGRDVPPKSVKIVSPEDVEWLEVIGTAKAWGFDAGDVKDLLDLIARITPKN
jgi:transcriptional regulator with XRE-family HTH domain